MRCRVDDTGGLGPVAVEGGEGGGRVTPASLVTARAVGRIRGEFAGIGIDWGCGTGLLAIVAARIPTVERVVALEVDAGAVEVARRNVAHAGSADRVVVVRADGFVPFDEEGRQTLAAIEGGAGFLVANPPASRDGDGLEWRRRLLHGARRYLRPGATVLLQVAAHYGMERIRTVGERCGYRYVDTVERSAWMPFDFDRRDLAEAFEAYVDAEAAGGPPFAFRTPEGWEVTASEVAAGAGPALTSWQAHRYEFLG